MLDFTGFKHSKESPELAVNKIQERVDKMRSTVETLSASPEFAFDQSLRKRLPEAHGLYIIQLIHTPEIIRAGRTKTAKGGLRQRVYQNHFMGNQKGNLRRQLMASGQCHSLEEAKSWLREHCITHVVIVEDDEERRWTEHFMLAVLRPRFSD